MIYGIINIVYVKQQLSTDGFNPGETDRYDIVSCLCIFNINVIAEGKILSSPLRNTYTCKISNSMKENLPIYLHQSY